MCDLGASASIAIGSALVSALGIGVGAVASNQQAEAQAEAQKRAIAGQVAYQNQMTLVNRQMYQAQGEQAVAAAEAQNRYTEKFNDYQTTIYDQNYHAANDAFVQEEQPLLERSMQEEAKASQEVQNIQKQRTQKMGEMVASSNMAGTNLQVLIGDYFRQDANFTNSVNQNLDFTNNQIAREMEGRRVAAQGRVAGLTKQMAPYRQVDSPIYRPYIPAPITPGALNSGADWLSTGLKIGGAGIGAWGDYYKMKKQGIS